MYVSRLNVLPGLTVSEVSVVLPPANRLICELGSTAAGAIGSIKGPRSYEIKVVPKAADVAMTNGMSVLRIIFFIWLFVRLLVVIRIFYLTADIRSRFDERETFPCPRAENGVNHVLQSKLLPFPGNVHRRHFCFRKARKIYVNFTHCI